jgi:hypothetical protein
MDCGLTTLFFWVMVVFSLMQTIQGLRLRMRIRRLKRYEHYYWNQQQQWGRW